MHVVGAVLLGTGIATFMASLADPPVRFWLTGVGAALALIGAVMFPS